MKGKDFDWQTNEFMLYCCTPDAAAQTVFFNVLVILLEVREGGV